MSVRTRKTLAAVTALIVGAVIGWFAMASIDSKKPQSDKITVAAPAAASITPPDLAAITCTSEPTDNSDVVIFRSIGNDDCTHTSGFTTFKGFHPPKTGLGVVCALRLNKSFVVITNTGNSETAGMYCDGFTGKGWTEDPTLASSFDQAMKENSHG